VNELRILSEFSDGYRWEVRPERRFNGKPILGCEAKEQGRNVIAEKKNTSS
jgi:hypothetical protein